MKICLSFIACTFLFLNQATAQPKYLIEFRHKGATIHSIGNPATFLSARAIQRRDRYNIAIDSTDLPVPMAWINQIRTIPNVTILNSSRWLNMISIQTNDPAALTAINSLDYVKSSRTVSARSTPHVNKFEEQYKLPDFSKPHEIQDQLNYGASSFNEISLHQGQFLHNVGLRGQGMQIAVMDGGFYQYTTLRAFDSMNANSQVLGTWDFVDRHSSVAEDNAHGMQCLSTIAANIPGEFVGKAPKASFFLFRTEDVNSEYPIEEFNWACGAERSDSSGADVISSSLGYGYQFSGGFPDYPYADLNGDKTISSRAADLAASRGLLLFIAAGNSGNDYWKKILTPADADSVLAVGAVNTSGTVATFSSYGPSADGRIKPDVASVGWFALVQSTANTTIGSNGTSFACPNMAGLGTCLWQGFPEVNNMRIVRALREAGSVASVPNDRIGYGIPDMKKAFSTLLKEYATAFVSETGCRAMLSWKTKDVGAMKFLIERKASADAGFVRVAEVAPIKGDLLANHSYEWADDLSDEPAGAVSYRITQVIDTISASYTTLLIGSTLVAAHGSICTGNEEHMIRLAPNPASGSTTIIFNNPEPVSRIDIGVYDMKGILVMNTTGSKTTGLYRKELNVSTLARGKYLIRIMNGTQKMATLELVKL